MSLSSLLLCQDQNILRVFRTALAELGVEVEYCERPEPAGERIAQKRFDAVLVECDRAREHLAVLKSLKRSAHNRRAITLAITKDHDHVQEALAEGAHFVIESPVSVQRLGTALKAAKNLMERERRRAFRKSVHTPVAFVLDHRRHFDAFVLDLSQTGMAIKTTDYLFEKGARVHLTFCLPGTTSPLDVQGDVIWTDGSGRTGISFSGMGAESERHLEKWLRERRHASQKTTPQLSATLVQPGSGSIAATVLDLNAGGMAIRSSERLSAGATLLLRIESPLDSGCVQARGKVVWAHHSGAAGIHFLDSSPQLEAMIKVWTT